MDPHDTGEGARALAELGGALASLAAGSVVRPGTDPHAAAITALLVADYLSQPDLRTRLQGAGLSEDAPRALVQLARAILLVVARLDGDYLREREGVAPDLVIQGSSARAAVMDSLAKALPGDPELAMWFEAIHLGTGIVDLIYDLRTLADLAVKRPEVAADRLVQEASGKARSAAIALEIALRAADSSVEAKARNTLARLWTLFVPAYECAAAAGRMLTRDEGRQRHFPPLAMIASHRRSRRRPLSLPPPPALPSRSPHRPLPSVRGTVKRPVLPGIEPLGASVDAIEPVAASASSLDVRRATRDLLEVEVGIATQSNFYCGFTENLSSEGVFVATYAVKPIGTKLDVVLTFPTGEVLRLAGTVRWSREGGGETWPGVGVQFESVSPQDEAKVRAFIRLREPIFFDD